MSGWVDKGEGGSGGGNVDYARATDKMDALRPGCVWLAGAVKAREGRV